MEEIRSHYGPDDPGRICQWGRPANVYPESREREQSSGNSGNERQREISDYAHPFLGAGHEVGDVRHDNDSNEEFRNIHPLRPDEICAQEKRYQSATETDPDPPSMVGKEGDGEAAEEQRDHHYDP